jgi:hypothetical protein
MNDEKINAAIAEVCGWTEHPDGYYDSIPNYCADLNAMHNAEVLIQDRNKYLNILAGVTEPIDGTPADHDWAFTRATAYQRAEVFLRTLGKWEEGE